MERVGDLAGSRLPGTATISLRPCPAFRRDVVSGRFRSHPAAYGFGHCPSLNGTQTVRGRSAKVDASFADIVRESDTLVALMGEFEARNGPFSFYGNLVWTKIGLERGDVRTRSVAPGISTTVGRTLGLDIEMAILEASATYEVPGKVAFHLTR
jgi:hypothetical protein